MEILIILFSVFLMVVGLAGVILPFLPGLPLIWLGLFVHAAAGNFEAISPTAVLVFLGLVVILMILDFLAPLLGAKKYKASKYGIIGAFLGLLVGIFTWGPLGILFGTFLGAFLGELIAGKEKRQAFNSAFGTFLGILVGSFLKLILGFIIFGYFIISFF